MFTAYSAAMPDWLQVILLGLIEGITEFLPISSTGHLLLAEQWLGKRSEHFTVFIQSGAVLAVLAVFKQRVRELATEWKKPKTSDYLVKMGVSFVITAIGGLSLKAAGWELPDKATPIAWALLVGGMFFIVIERQQELKETKASNEAISLPRITWTVAVAFGLAQLLAMVFPGASRSGTTILIGLCLGMMRRDAVEYSFLLGVPTLLSAGAYQLASAIKHNPTAVRDEAPMLLLGTVVSGVTAFAAVKWMLTYLQRNNFVAFGWYRIVLGTVILTYLGRGG